MSTWLSRTFKRLSADGRANAPEPLPPAQLARVIERARQLLAVNNYVDALPLLLDAVVSNPDDADALTHYGVANLMAGDVGKARAAFTRAIQIDPDHLAASKYLVNACNQLGDYYGLEAAALNALRLAPRDHEVLNMYGAACSNRLNVEKAAECFSKAVEIRPTELMTLLNIEGLSNISLIDRRKLDRSPKIATARSQAINRLRAAHRRGQLDDPGIKNLVLLLRGAQETFQEAVALVRESARRDDLHPDLATEVANIFTMIGDVPNMLRFRKLSMVDNPDVPRLQSILAYSNLSAGIGAWDDNWKTVREFERFSNLGIFASEVPSWTGQRLGKKKLLVYQEQGIGDAIMALRAIPLLAKRGIRFDLWVQPPLADLASSLTGYENLIRSTWRPDANSIGCDYASTLFGLISALGITYQDIRSNPTLLAAPSERLPNVRSRLRALTGKRVGLSYGGNPDRRDDWLRAVPPLALKPLTQLRGISWVNLVFDRRPDRGDVIRMFGADDPMAEAKDFGDTAAIVSELDAVIAIDSSVAHLAASLGKPVWVLIPTLADWRWQMGEHKSPWWPNATLLRSPEPGNWGNVIEELTRDVGTWYG